MIAQLKVINLNAKMKSKSGKSFSGVEVTYQPQPYKGEVKEPVTRFLFSNNPVAKGLQGFKAGDWAEIKFDTDQYRTPLSIDKASEPGASKTSTATFAPRDDTTNLRIARAVAIKEATVLALAMAAGDAFPKTKIKSKEFMAQQVLEIAQLYEPYLTLTEQSDELEMPEIGEDDFDQEGFEE